MTRSRILAAVLGVFALLGGLVACDPVVATADPSPVNFFGNSTPGTISDPDTASVELGLKFTVDVAGQATGVRFYKGPKNTGTHKGHFWSTAGTQLATVTFSGETASGWQSASFATPVTLTPGVTYIVSYVAPKGRYSADNNYFATARNAAPLHAPAGANGVYHYGSQGGFPSDTYQSSNYWVDVNFVPAPPAATTTTVAPTTTTTEAPTTTAPPETTTIPPTTTTTTIPPAGLDGRSVTPTNTGWEPTGVTLTPYSGPDTITTAGTVLDGQDVSVCLTISAPNVTIRRSRIRCSGDFGLNQRANAQGLLVEDVELTSTTTSGPGEQGSVDRAMLITDGATVRRSLIHGTRRGLIFGNNVLVESSYIGDNVNSTDAHTTAVASIGGAHNVVLRGNNLSTAPGTNASSAGSFYPEVNFGGPNVDVTLDSNLIDTDGGYALYVGYSPQDGESPNQNMRIVNNWFGVRYNVECGQFGPDADSNNGLEAGGGTWTGNRWFAPGMAKDGSIVED